MAIQARSTASAPLLEVERIESGYGPTRVLRGIDLSVLPGEVVAILGPNGAGKTTLLSTISGLCTIHGGTVSFEGRPLAGLAPHSITRLGIGHCPEGRRIFQRLTVEENLTTGHQGGRGQSFAALRDRAFGLFPILAERRHEPASRLSGGQQQMLAVARAIMGEPRLLMLDEPSLGLAPKVVNQILGIILELATAGISIALVEQNVAFALEISDYAYVLENGHCVLEGPSHKLLADPALREAYLPKV